MAREQTLCRCTQALGAVSGLFASLAAAALLAEDRCLDLGGRVSDTAWLCEPGAGAAVSLWSLVTPAAAVAVAALVGVPVFLAVEALGRRWIARHAARPEG